MGKRPIRIAATLGMVAALIRTYQGYKDGGWHRVMVDWTGYDPNYGWNITWAKALIPMVTGIAVSAIGAKAGVNKYLPKGVGL